MIEQAQNLKEPNSLHWAVIINPTEFTEESMKFKPKQKKWKFVATNCWTNVKTDQLAPTLFLPAIAELSKTNVPNILLIIDARCFINCLIELTRAGNFLALQLMREPNSELDGSFGNLLQCSQICYTLTITQAKFQGQISVLIDPTSKLIGTEYFCFFKKLKTSYLPN